MPQPPKILSRKTASPSKLFRVEAVELEFSNGIHREYEYLVSGKHGAVIIVAMISDHEVLLVEEYGIGLERYEWALPKGKVDPGETALEAANRELQEEAGYAAADLVALKCTSQSPNYMQHKTQIVLARELSPSVLEGDEPEPMAVRRHSLHELPSLVARPDFSEARSIAALYIARDWLLAKGLL